MGGPGNDIYFTSVVAPSSVEDFLKQIGATVPSQSLQTRKERRNFDFHITPKKLGVKKDKTDVDAFFYGTFFNEIMNSHTERSFYCEIISPKRTIQYMKNSIYHIEMVLEANFLPESILCIIGLSANFKEAVDYKILEKLATLLQGKFEGVYHSRPRK